jgi:hypothetical protein
MPIGWASAGELNSTGRTYVWYRFAAADNEAGPTVTTTSNIRMSALVYRLTGAGAPTATFATGSDPPAHTSPRSGQHRFIAGWSSRRTNNSATAPANFTGLATAALDSSNSNDRTRVSAAHTDCVDGSSIDPGAFGTTGENNPHTVTIAVPTPASPPGSCPAVSFVASSSNNGATSASIALTQPAGVAVGDVMVAAIVHNEGNTAAIVPPIGWTLQRHENQSNNVGVAVYTATVASVPATAPSWTWSFVKASDSTSYSINKSGGIAAFRGAGSTYAAVAGQNNSSGSMTAPSVNVAVANSQLVAVFGNKVSGLHTAPNGMTRRIMTTDANGWNTSLYSEARSSTGNTGTRQSNQISEWVAVSLVLPPC